MKPERTDATPARANRSVDAVRARKDEVAELLFVRGFSHGRIRREKSREWGLSSLQVWRYIRVVEQQFGRANADDPGITRDKFREMLTEKIAKFEEAAEAGSAPHVSALPRLYELLGKVSGLLTDRLDVKHSGTIAHLHATPSELAALSDGELEAVRAFHAAREQRLLGPSIVDAEVIEPTKGS